MSPNVKYGLELIIIYPYWLISCKKYTTLKQDIKNSGNGGWGGKWELSVLSAQFFCKTKTKKFLI